MKKDLREIILFCFKLGAILYTVILIIVLFYELFN